MKKIEHSPMPETVSQITHVSTSYTPIDFYNALHSVTEGKKITREEWGNKEIYGVLDSGVLKLHKTDNIMYSWVISEGDLLGNDWFVL